MTVAEHALSAALRVVAELARSRPPIDSGRGTCSLCGEYVPLRATLEEHDAPGWHDPECPWRMAVEFDPDILRGLDPAAFGAYDRLPGQTSLL